jgi:predicted amidohydrolase
VTVLYYDIDGKPIEDHLEWARLFERRRQDQAPESWWRKQTTLGDDVSVSTVWLGLDHSFGMGPPLIFETMIFGGEHDQDQWRYATKAEAWDHHEEVVAALRAGEEPHDPKGKGAE